MNTEERGKLVLNSCACTFCLGCSHTTEGCPMKSYRYPCDRNGRGKYHSRLLHGCSTPGLNLHMKLDQQSEMPGMMDSRGSVILLVEDVKISNGTIAKIFFTALWSRHLITAPCSSIFGIEILLVGPILALIKWGKYLPFSSFHCIYEHAPNAFIDPSEKVTKFGFSSRLRVPDLMQRLNFISFISNISYSNSIQLALKCFGNRIVPIQ